jgi:FKBP-type peptidyl-prolyl cis-trans isomerase SlyD
MEIKENSVVVLTYELRTTVSDGTFETIETVDKEQPFAFIFGMSGLPEGFENNIEKLKQGESFDFTVLPEDGYGDRDEDAEIALPKSIFEIEDGKVPEGMLTVGNTIPMTNEDGEKILGLLVADLGTEVIMDFNHPLAGKTMYFKGEILEVRPATASEIEHGHVHGDHGVHH